METHRVLQRMILKKLSSSLGFPWPSLFLHWLLAWTGETGVLGLILFLENILPWWQRNKAPFFRYLGYHGKKEFSEWSGESLEKFFLSRKLTGLENIRKGVKLFSVFIEVQIQTQACFVAWEVTWALEHVQKNWKNVNLLQILMQNVDLIAY